VQAGCQDYSLSPSCPAVRLSDAEADQCRKLWDDMAAVLKKAEEKKE
jgi:hypothetical protein